MQIRVYEEWEERGREIKKVRESKMENEWASERRRDKNEEKKRDEVSISQIWRIASYLYPVFLFYMYISINIDSIYISLYLLY